MDWASFGLTRRPFRPTPDTASYVPTVGHDAAFAAVMRAFTDGDAAASVRGEPGTGKTLLGLRFLEAIPADTKRVMLHAPPETRAADLLQAVLFDLGQQYQGLSEQELRLAVHGELLTGLADGRCVVLLVDEAHHLTPEAGEEHGTPGQVAANRVKAQACGFAVPFGDNPTVESWLRSYRSMRLAQVGYLLHRQPEL